jgi:predicted Zn-ribbon and HTH transcriptional regulator
MSKLKGHPSDEWHQYTFDFDGAALVEATERESISVTLRVCGDVHDRQHLIEQLQALTQEMWSDMPPPHLTPMERALPGDTRCKDCGHAQREHVSRGARVLECPNRCPSCDDQSIARGTTLSGEPVWVALGWGEGAAERDRGQEIDFCPFCGVDLRGEWKAGP